MTILPHFQSLMARWRCLAWRLAADLTLSRPLLGGAPAAAGTAGFLAALVLQIALAIGLLYLTKGLGRVFRSHFLFADHDR